MVLYEDKKYYPSAEETYGPETETLVMEEDAQPLEVPIIAPIKEKRIERLEAEPLHTRYTNEFLATLMSNADLVRNVAIVGALHHGKTTVMDMLVEQTHDLQVPHKQTDKQLRFTDTRLDEQVSSSSSVAPNDMRCKDPRCCLLKQNPDIHVHMATYLSVCLFVRGNIATVNAVKRADAILFNGEYLLFSLL